MYFQIGDLIFSNLLGFSGLSINRGGKIQEISRANNKAILQKTGTELQTLSISINVNRQFADVDAITNQLNDYSENGTIVSVLDGTGFYYGRFIVMTVSQSVQTLDVDGAKIAVGLSIELKEYAEDNKESDEVIAARNSATALEENKPIRILQKAIPVTPLSSVLDLSLEGKSNSLASIELVNAAVSNPSQLQTLMQKAKVKIDSAAKAYPKGLNEVRANQTKFENAASGYEDDLEELTIIANSMKNALEVQDLNSAVGFSEAMLNQINVTANSQRPLDIRAITRKVL